MLDEKIGEFQGKVTLVDSARPIDLARFRLKCSRQ
jgi:hypothetical protein